MKHDHTMLSASTALPPPPTSPQAYDDVFRTLLNDCKQLIIPLVNIAFGEHYTGDEKISFYPNEHFINAQDGKEVKRITDTCFIIEADDFKKYHWECQSGADNSLLVRIFEYDSQIALDDGEITDNVLRVKFPKSAILYLRSNENTPDVMRIEIAIPDGKTLGYDVPALKVKNYSIDEIFEKDLLFLIPFYIFSHEHRFKVYNEDKQKLETLVKEYEDIKNRLEALCRRGKIDEYTKCTITDMSHKVLTLIAKGYEQVRKGVDTIMGGQVLEYEAKTIRNKALSEGLELGRVEGLEQGTMCTLYDLVHKNLLSIKDAAAQANLSESAFSEQMNAYNG